MSACRFCGVRLLLSVATLCVWSAVAEQGDYEVPPFFYSTTEATGRVEDLITEMQEGRWSPPKGNAVEILRAFLDKLEIPIESQTLVFSKTSEQGQLIHPWNPRALYFNDETYVGWVPGGKVEFADIDPRLGPVFYVFDPSLPEGSRVIRDNGCLSCHATSRTNYVPGVMARSVSVDTTGAVMETTGVGNRVTDVTPLRNRWGGWYVTGQHGETRHLGNVMGPKGKVNPKLDVEKGANLLTLDGLVEMTRYLQPGSDIMALMVMEHQFGVQSRITEAMYAMGVAEARYGPLIRDTDGAVGKGTIDLIRGRHKLSILAALLSRDEALMPSGGVRGSGEFEKAFLEGARRDSQGRSLRDFDGEKRLFRYRCSYLIGSDSFVALPADLRAELYAELREVLAGSDKEGEFAYLGKKERQAIQEILEETEAEIRGSWTLLAEGKGVAEVAEFLRERTE